MGAFVRSVADSGTDGRLELTVKSGARGPSASFRSGGTTNFGIPRLSGATGMAFARATVALARAFAWFWGWGVFFLGGT